MAEHELVEAFSDCLDRINAGESVEQCIARYPQHTERLRVLLDTGRQVYRARVSREEVKVDREQLRSQITMVIQRQVRYRVRRWVAWGIRLSAVAVVVIVVGVVALALTGPAVGNIFTNTVSVLNGPVDTTAVNNPPSFAPTSVYEMTPAPHGTATYASEATSLAVLPTAGFLGATLQPPVMVTPSPTAIAPMDSQVVSSPPPAVQAIPLQAGEIDDNAQWDNYLLYRRNYLAEYAYSVHDVDVTGRQIITVTDANGLPVLGARVRVYSGSLLSQPVAVMRTYANGQALFFPNAVDFQQVQSFSVLVDGTGIYPQTFTLDVSKGPNWNVVVSRQVAQQNSVKLDVLFLLDATGSMSDEIAQLQNNILAISQQIAVLPGNVDTHYGLIAYRDRGDAYVVQNYDFTADVAVFQNTLNTIQAGGGGDTPESLSEGLYYAIRGVAWRGDDTVKLVFLVADAAPHLDYAGDYEYTQQMTVAAQLGIKIHPIASSGLTPDGEYIFRQLAQYTMGHLLFLTYQQGASGAPGDSRPDLHVGEPSDSANQQQGDYTVERLDELVLRLITDELSALNTRATVQRAVGLTPVGSTDVPPADMLPTPLLSPTLSAVIQPAAPPVAAPSPEIKVIRYEVGGSSPLQNLIFLLVLVPIGFGLIIVGYSINRRPPPPRPKRKREEIIEDDDY